MKNEQPYRALPEKASSPKRWLIFGALAMELLCAVPSNALAESCIVIDTDSHLDDHRAVAVLAPTGRIAAIVVTEGIARAPEEAGAMETFLRRSDLAIPVIVGASASPDRQYSPNDELPSWRATAEQLNGTLTAPVVPSTQPPADMVAALKRLTSQCSKISLLIIGPWTSFMRYSVELLAKVDRVVVQGRPYPDEPGGEPSGFNCSYDIDSCKAAFDLLVGRQLRVDRKLRANWIDIPNGPEPCGSAEPGIDKTGKKIFAFSPTDEWIGDLRRAGGSAAVVAEILNANPHGWEKTDLWDDLAALFLLRPELFAARGGHLEPCVPAAAVRNLLTEAMAAKASK